MALKHAVYVSTPKLNELGTLSSLYHSVKFCDGTINKYDAGINKAYCMVLTLKSGESATCPLSIKVSKTVKTAFENDVPKNDILSAISSLRLCEDIADPSKNYICGPRGTGGQEEEFVIGSSKTVISYEELAAY
jgi:hypothetical protein